MTQQLIDYSAARPSPAGLVRAGIRGVGRYVGALGSVSKQLGATEAAALRAVGLDIFLLVEEAAGGAMGGRTTGVRHATTARSFAAGLGAPDSTALYFAVDFDVTAAQWPTVADYLRGAASVPGVGAARVGIYGGHNAIAWARRDGVAAWFFQTYGWSGVPPVWVPDNHVEQWKNNQTVPGTVGSVDLCRTEKTNYGQWAAGSQPIGDDDMPKIFRASPSGAVWISNGPQRFHLATQQQFADALNLWGIKGQDVVQITDTQATALGQDVGTLSTGSGTGGLVAHTHQIPAVEAEDSGPAVASP